MLVGHVYSALLEEMQAGARRAVTLGIRALGCVVNLGKLKHPTSVRVALKGNALILVEVYKYKSQIYKTDIRTHICKQRKNNKLYFIKSNTCTTTSFPKT